MPECAQARLQSCPRHTQIKVNSIAFLRLKDKKPTKPVNQIQISSIEFCVCLFFRFNRNFASISYLIDLCCLLQFCLHCKTSQSEINQTLIASQLPFSLQVVIPAIVVVEKLCPKSKVLYSPHSVVASSYLVQGLLEFVYPLKTRREKRKNTFMRTCTFARK